MNSSRVSRPPQMPANVSSSMLDNPSGGQPNFVREITERLRFHQHPDPEFWVRYNGGPIPATLTHPDPLLRRFHINRHWQGIIAMETLKRNDDLRFISDSLTARYCLMDQVDYTLEHWLQGLNEILYPFILRYEIGFPQH